MTAVTVVVTGTWQDPDVGEVGGITITPRAFESVVSWFPCVLAVAVLLFACSTILSNSFYGMKGFGYLFGDDRTAEHAYKVVYLFFTVVGAAAALGPVILFADSVIAAVLPGRGSPPGNVDYWRQLQAGEIQVRPADRAKLR